MIEAGNSTGREYLYGGLDEAGMASDPVRQFELWYNEAVAAGIDLPNAMALATSDTEGKPTVRYVLMKQYGAGGFTFFTNSGSVKGGQLALNPHAAAVFYWSRMDRQVRLEGPVVYIPEHETDEYFSSRPRQSQIGACVAVQSSRIENRTVLELEYERLEAKYSGGSVPRPADWRGYRIIPNRIEYWQGRAGRLHDRIEYTRVPGGSWEVHRLAP